MFKNSLKLISIIIHATCYFLHYHSRFHRACLSVCWSVCCSRMKNRRKCLIFHKFHFVHHSCHLFFEQRPRRGLNPVEHRGTFQSIQLGIGLIELRTGVISNNARCTVLTGLTSLVCDTLCTQILFLVMSNIDDMNKTSTTKIHFLLMLYRELASKYSLIVSFFFKIRPIFF